MSTPIRPSMKNMVKPSRVVQFCFVPKCVPRPPRYDFHTSPISVSGRVISSLYRFSCTLSLFIVCFRKLSRLWSPLMEEERNVALVFFDFDCFFM